MHEIETSISDMLYKIYRAVTPHSHNPILSQSTGRKNSLLYSTSTDNYVDITLTELGVHHHEIIFCHNTKISNLLNKAKRRPLKIVIMPMMICYRVSLHKCYGSDMALRYDWLQLTSLTF